MEIWIFLLSTLIVLFIGMFTGLIYAKLVYQNIFGGIKIAMLVGICGTIIGGFVFDLLFKLSFFKILIEIPYFNYLLVNKLDINFIALILGSWVFLRIYQYVSEHTERS